MTMFWTGGSTKMTPMSCFLNMKIYKRFVVVRPVFWSVSGSAIGKTRSRSLFAFFLERNCESDFRFGVPLGIVSTSCIETGFLYFNAVTTILLGKSNAPIFICI